MCAKRDGTRGKVEAVDNVVVEAAANSDEVQVDVAEGRPNDVPLVQPITRVRFPKRHHPTAQAGVSRRQPAPISKTVSVGMPTNGKATKPGVPDASIRRPVLSKNSKKLTDNGESGDTFRAIARYARNYRPAVIILENVDGAPWELIRAIWENDHEPIEECFERLNSGEDATEQGLDAFWDDDDPAYSDPLKSTNTACPGDF
ncbi:MAG: hypothetical protein ALECFALPRED_009865 [Alectoria fallacina]|uniref:Uncharacterized protein n=1 Tax=Alectoria fallacina TaxID=1903189 RepID=A0A8H3J8F7_9LECA|nr:MAG: hypothetical protein ALECFALPRED_009865 [Alectoria fallacina]